ncbi:MAG: exosome non-catalytic core subunit rrp4 [Chaenotheca gracillima]|nr:MAG: exosome non-catalytic core subunit rrp4 [Chaenotheca gracillima]
MTYHVTEPHPSVPSNHRMHTGRGGAGNVTYVRSSTPSRTATGPASRVPLFTSGSSSSTASSTASTKQSRFLTGRGGAGNVLPTSERAIFSFDEELARQQLRDERRAPIYHVGRGGAGNTAHTDRSGSFSSNDSVGSRRSVDSEGAAPFPNAAVMGGADKARRSIESAIRKFNPRNGRSSNSFSS